MNSTIGDVMVTLFMYTDYFPYRVYFCNKRLHRHWTTIRDVMIRREIIDHQHDADDVRAADDPLINHISLRRSPSNVACWRTCVRSALFSDLQHTCSRKVCSVYKVNEYATKGRRTVCFHKTDVINDISYRIIAWNAESVDSALYRIRDRNILGCHIIIYIDGTEVYRSVIEESPRGRLQCEQIGPIDRTISAFLPGILDYMTSTLIDSTAFLGADLRACYAARHFRT